MVRDRSVGRREVHHDYAAQGKLHAAILMPRDVLVRDRTPLRAELIERMPKVDTCSYREANTALDRQLKRARHSVATRWGP